MIFFKKKFRELREMAGLSLDDVAKSMSVGKSTVQRWEKKKNFQPLPERIPLLASILHCKESDLVRYGNPVQDGILSVRDEDKEIQNLLFGADVGEEVRNIRAAYFHRSELSEKDQDYARIQAEDNAEIIENLQSLFVKLSDRLQVRFSPGSGRGLDDFKFGLIRELIKSDLPADAKDKALQVVEKYHP